MQGDQNAQRPCYVYEVMMDTKAGSCWTSVTVGNTILAPSATDIDMLHECLVECAQVADIDAVFHRGTVHDVTESADDVETPHRAPNP